MPIWRSARKPGPRTVAQGGALRPRGGARPRHATGRGRRRRSAASRRSGKPSARCAAPSRRRSGSASARACDTFFDRYKRRDEIELEASRRSARRSSPSSNRWRCRSQRRRRKPRAGGDGRHRPAGAVAVRQRGAARARPVAPHPLEPVLARRSPGRRPAERPVHGRARAAGGRLSGGVPRHRARHRGQPAEDGEALREGRGLPRRAPRRRPIRRRRWPRCCARRSRRTRSAGAPAKRHGGARWGRRSAARRRPGAASGRQAGEAGRELGERFHRACSRFFEQYRRQVPQHATQAQPSRSRSAAARWRRASREAASCASGCDTCSCELHLLVTAPLVLIAFDVDAFALIFPPFQRHAVNSRPAQFARETQNLLEEASQCRQGRPAKIGDRAKVLDFTGRQHPHSRLA